MPPVDAVDLICQDVLHVETATPTLNPDPVPVLGVETKDCSVCLTRLDQILADELVKVAPSSASDLPAGQHFTRSRSAKPTARTGKRPCRANTGISYDEVPMSPAAKPVKPQPKPSRAGPLQHRIDSRTKSTVEPNVRLPGVKTDKVVPSDSDATLPLEEEPQSSELTEDDIPLAQLQTRIRGVFKTKRHVLEKKTESRKYKCRMCPEKSPSCRALTEHHQKKHGIIYCSKCNKAFNNPHTLTKHMYEHGKKKHVCNNCGSKFPFKSQLTTHKLTHRKANQLYMYPKCGKHFKSKSNLNHHTALHTKPWLKCPDCKDYRTKDKRNFESHRLSHSKIERYFCDNCGVEFVYNTQKLRHIKDKVCKQN